MRTLPLMVAVAGREAGNLIGNPVDRTAPAGMRPGGRRTRLDLQQCYRIEQSPEFAETVAGLSPMAKRWLAEIYLILASRRSPASQA